MANTDRLLGQVLGDTFRLKKRLAAGTMGMLYEAEDLPRSRRVAVKLLHPSVSRDPVALGRYRAEAQTAGSLGQPHLVDFVDFSTPDAKGPYIVTELLEGEDLAARLQRLRRLGVRTAVAITRDILAALAAAHAAGVPHRDLKPSNVFLCRKGGRADYVKLVDFGLSNLWAASGSVASTRPVGTARYFAPEQARGRPAEADARADLWAVGTILYEMLAGAPAFAGPDRAAILARIAEQEPPPLRTVRSELRPELEAVVTRALAKVPIDRFASAAEMREALAAAARLSGDWEESTEAEPLPPPPSKLTDPFAEINTTPQEHGPDSFKDPFAVMRTVPVEKEPEKAPRVATKTFPPPLQGPGAVVSLKALAETAARAEPPEAAGVVKPVSHGTTQELTIDDIAFEDSDKAAKGPPPLPGTVAAPQASAAQPGPEADLSQPTLAWWRNRLVLGGAGAGLLVLIVVFVLVGRSCSGGPKVVAGPRLDAAAVAAAPAPADAAPAPAVAMAAPVPADATVAAAVDAAAPVAAPAPTADAAAVAAAPVPADAAPAASAPAAMAAAAAPAAEAPAPAKAAPARATEPAAPKPPRAARPAVAAPARAPKAAPAKEEKGLSRQKVRSTMAPLERAVKACFRNFNVSKGHATLSVTVDPSGKVTRAATTGKYAGSPAGGCAAAAARRAKFPSFTGKPATISYTYDLR